MKCFRDWPYYNLISSHYNQNDSKAIPLIFSTAGFWKPGPLLQESNSLLTAHLLIRKLKYWQNSLCNSGLFFPGVKDFNPCSCEIYFGNYHLLYILCIWRICLDLLSQPPFPLLTTMSHPALCTRSSLPCKGKGNWCLRHRFWGTWHSRSLSEMGQDFFSIPWKKKKKKSAVDANINIREICTRTLLRHHQGGRDMDVGFFACAFTRCLEQKQTSKQFSSYKAFKYLFYSCSTSPYFHVLFTVIWAAQAAGFWGWTLCCGLHQNLPMPGDCLALALQEPQGMLRDWELRTERRESSCERVSLRFPH